MIPGYTGYIPQYTNDKNSAQYPNPYDNKKSQIPGYQGYVSGIKSENVFSQTYGRTTEASAQGLIQRGFDLPGEERYMTVSQMTYEP